MRPDLSKVQHNGLLEMNDFQYCTHLILQNVPNTGYKWSKLNQCILQDDHFPETFRIKRANTGARPEQNQ